MVVSGLPVRIPDHAEQIATMALDLLHQSGRFKIKHLPEVPLQLRIGLHTGLNIYILLFFCRQCFPILLSRSLRGAAWNWERRNSAFFFFHEYKCFIYRTLLCWCCWTDDATILFIRRHSEYGESHGKRRQALLHRFIFH